MTRPQQSRQWLNGEQMSIRREVDYIIGRAADYDTRVVTLGSFVLFSTRTGDAWLLDSEDGLAVCLARDGDPQPIHITETGQDFAVEWNANYQIDGDIFIVSDRSGRIRSIMGYPTRAILNALKGAGQDGNSDGARRLDNLVQEGYALLEVGQAAAACDQWLAAWDIVKQLAKPEMRTADAFDEAYPLTEFLSNWCHDLMFELRNAGIDDPRYHERRLQFAREFLAQFPDEGADTHVNFMRAQGEALWELGRRDEAEATFAALVERFPDKGWGYIGWADHYWLFEDSPKDYARAEAILQRALARPRLRDRADVLERLRDVYAESGQREKLAKVEKQPANAARQPRAEHPAANLRGAPANSRMVSSPAPKLGRNDPCWCGSGKKYKHCHLGSDQHGE